MKEQIAAGAIAVSVLMGGLSLATDEKNIEFDKKYFPVSEGGVVTLDTSTLRKKDEKIDPSEIKDLPESILYNSVLMQNIVDSNDRAIAALSEKEVQSDINQSSTTAADYVRGRNRIFNLEAKVSDLEARILLLEKK